MKKTHFIYLVIAGCLLIFLAMFMSKPENPPVEETVFMQEKNQIVEPAEVQTSKQRSIVPRRDLTGTKNDDSTIKERLKELVEDKPINFYGQVVDQFGVPIAGANIHFIWTKFWPQESVEARAVSDNAGNFSLINKMGRRMVVHVAKDGY